MDEWYNFDVNVHSLKSTWVLAQVDEGSYNHSDYERSDWENTRMGNPHPIVWCRKRDNRSRVFYSAIGHRRETYDLPFYRTLLSGAIRWCGFRNTNTRKRLVLQAIRPKVSYMNVVAEYGGFSDLHTIQSLIPPNHATSKIFIISDSIVAPIYAKQLCDNLTTAGYQRHMLITVAAGEKSKSIKVFGEVAEKILTNGVDKFSTIVTLGGGMANNLGGFLASTIYRGLGLVHIPTSLLAQVDAAIDFKQAVNHSCAKNQIGAFYAPTHVLIDPMLVESLPMTERVNGMGEVIKHALAQDADFFAFLEKHDYRSLHDVDFLWVIVTRTMHLKVTLLNTGQQQDIFDMIAQYGHAIGHSIEHLSDPRLNHGAAIAIGMCISAEISFLLNLCNSKLVQQHYEIFTAYKLPTSLPDYMSIKEIFNTLTHDKHYVKGLPVMLLLKDVAVPHVENNLCAIAVTPSVLKKAMRVNQRKNNRTFGKL
eukprot:TRINITY_DN18389_c0_g1_i1.p1 TRINITY_DN18389_c0_g1~~TRINITY_DN18389_c0_g1_i1.p1  ORF type:complete len:487 (+),score=62.85 TRINITY_DN18389_c0_g1_i1:29-1462(+)